MNKSQGRSLLILLGAFSFGAVACGSADEPQLAHTQSSSTTALATETTVAIAAAPEVSDLELSVVANSSGSIEFVSVSVEIRSLSGGAIDAPGVFVEPGDGVVVLGIDESCTDSDDGRLRCLSSRFLDDGTGVALDMTLHLDPAVENPTVKFSAESGTPAAAEPDPSNNVVQVVFVGATAQPAPIPVPTTPVTTAPTTTTAPATMPTYTLKVHSDGCGVFRTGNVGDDLTWVVTDTDGFQVLGRNAAGETQYRYFRPGEYTMVLEAWGGSYYIAVSNEVNISC